MNLFDQRGAENQYCRRCGANPCACDDDDFVEHTVPLPVDERLPTIDARFEQFSTSNPHVLTAALQIAQEWLARGDTYISTKAILENLRVQRTIGGATVQGDGGYRLNNDFSAPLARWLVAQDRRLDGVLRMRERKTK